MRTTPTEPGTYVLVIDRAVFRQVSAEEIDAINAAMENGLASVTFRANSQTIRALIEGVSIGWAPERHPTSQVRTLGRPASGPGSAPRAGLAPKGVVR